MRIVAGRLDSCDKHIGHVSPRFMMRREFGDIPARCSAQQSYMHLRQTAHLRVKVGKQPGPHEQRQGPLAQAVCSCLLGVVNEIEPPPAACADQNVRL